MHYFYSLNSPVLSHLSTHPMLCSFSQKNKLNMKKTKIQRILNETKQKAHTRYHRVHLCGPTTPELSVCPGVGLIYAQWQFFREKQFFFSESRYQLANSFLIGSWVLCPLPLLWAGFCLTWICLGVWTVTISLCWYVYQPSFVEDAIFMASYSPAGSYNLSAFSSA